MGYDRGDSFSFDFLNQIEFHLIQNQKEDCHHDHIPFDLKGNGNRVSSVYPLGRTLVGFNRAHCKRSHA